MKFCCENSIRCRVPPMSAMIGEPYAGPSPVQLHRTFPVAGSNELSVPCVVAAEVKNHLIAIDERRHRRVELGLQRARPEYATALCLSRHPMP